MIAAWPEWRIYGLCKNCAYNDGKQIWVEDYVIAYISFDDQNQEIKYCWEQSGSGPITFKPLKFIGMRSWNRRQSLWYFPTSIIILIFGIIRFDYR
jgi:hypothetical protein